ncbi:hypothetical protein HMPREF9135_0786 [Segatella baroniae F0067]|uniref:Uncharacterized protein n=1 Tax=Segatella baroniae F0067 TaxID=1115809 RepID=U2P5L1_9BACT|nr:hypothetical protein HMPREF9135_0786 [Segatella baroniae F0067]
MAADFPRPGKRQNKRRRTFRGPGNAKTNGGGLSEARETPKQTAGRQKNEGSLASKKANRQGGSAQCTKAIEMATKPELTK